MRTLLIVAGIVFSACGAMAAYFAFTGGERGYDLNFVLPIDARQMPEPALPAAASQPPSDTATASENRAEAGNAPPAPSRPPVQFGDRPGAASEAPSGQ